MFRMARGAACKGSENIAAPFEALGCALELPRSQGTCPGTNKGSPTDGQTCCAHQQYEECKDRPEQDFAQFFHLSSQSLAPLQLLVFFLPTIKVSASGVISFSSVSVSPLAWQLFLWLYPSRAYADWKPSQLPPWPELPVRVIQQLGLSPSSSLSLPRDEPRRQQPQLRPRQQRQLL